MKNFIVVIPAYNPMKELPKYVQALLNQKVVHVIVVNDGCDPTFDALFTEIGQFDNATVLTHPVNLGKGSALKTAFKYILTSNLNGVGVVTADADEQHLLKDVINVGDNLVMGEEQFILGVRQFTKKEVPFRSYIGNKLASKVFDLLLDYYLEDTQTGLRGMKYTELEWLTKLSGDNFEYEINMLIQLVHQNKTVKEIEIETVYHENHQSNYETFKDTLAIGAQLIKGYIEIHE